ncbi:MAG: glycosyltransferase family 4 protein [Proteobacteria bacterium]|nr:glycosyltransferase family 4 protein [Pseudomonadota bacterium]
MRIVTCIGDATSIDAHGGLPFHLLDAGRRLGFLDDGWQLDLKALNRSRMLWNAGRLLTRGEFGGYQYSESFLQALVRQVPPASLNPDEIISIFPLFPPAPKASTRLSFYIDATLKQNFEEYGISTKVGRSLIMDALKREGVAYHNATRIICRARSTAKSVVESYGIDPRKVHVVPGGANIIDDRAQSRAKPSRASLTPIRLGFIGKDWRRKNLGFILDVADVLTGRGVAVEVAAAGFDPARGPRPIHLRACGFIDKRAHLQRFVDFLSSCHFTCLFSRAEAFGLSNRESLRLGVPVLASRVGGIPDTIPRGCGHIFAKEAKPTEIADVIESYVQEPNRYWALRDALALRRDEFTWEAAIRKMQAIWSGETRYRYDRLEQADV